jgi:hypothetical protein
MIEDDVTPERLQKLADLLSNRVLDRTGFHETFHWLQKDVTELGYSTVAEFVEDYEWASTLADAGMLDDYLPASDEPDFEVFSVTFPKP